jgi:hypothetical protein
VRLPLFRFESLRCHRAGLRAFWRWKSLPRGGRPRTAANIRRLIREMSVANPLWERSAIHGELPGKGRPARSPIRANRPWNTFGVIGPPHSEENTCGDASCSRCSRRRARISSPCIGCTLGEPCLALRTCKRPVLARSGAIADRTPPRPVARRVIYLAFALSQGISRHREHGHAYETGTAGAAETRNGITLHAIVRL